MNFKKIILPNKLRVILAPMKETETVTVMIAAATGSRYENKKNNGLSHFLEHMFFKGTKNRPTTLSISEELDGIGGDYNAFTGKDWTAYYVKVDFKHLATALDVVSDMLLNSLFKEDEIEREKGTIVQEFNMYEDTPMRIIGDHFETLLYGDQPLGWKIVGTKENVRRFSRSDFLKYMNDHYRADNMAVIVAGKFDESETVKKIEKYFGKMSNGRAKKRTKVIENQVKPQIDIAVKKTDQTHFILGVRAYDMFHPDRYALSILANILGGNMSSRLFIEVRERRGLAYRVSSFVEEYHDAGYLATQCGVEHLNLEKAVKVILKEYKKMTEKKVSERELLKAKEYLKAKLVMGMETSDDVAGFLTSQEILKNNVILPAEISQRIDTVTADDVLRVAKDIFRNNKLNLVVLGPGHDKKNVEKIVKF